MKGREKNSEEVRLQIREKEQIAHRCLAIFFVEIVDLITSHLLNKFFLSPDLGASLRAAGPGFAEVRKIYGRPWSFALMEMDDSLGAALAAAL